MSGSYLQLPKDQEQLVRALDHAVAAAEEKRNIASIEWWVVHGYLQGCREFVIHSYRKGEVGVLYKKNVSELEFRYEALLAQYRIELGRYQSLDLTPVCNEHGYGLDSVRKAGIGHATLRYATAGIDLEDKKVQAVECALKFGTFGVYHYRCQGDNVQDRTCIDIVPPWELLCMPAEIDTHGDRRGITRKRPVPLEWLNTLDIPKIGGASDTELRVRTVPVGGSPSNYGELAAGAMFDAAYTGQMSGSTQFQGTKDEPMKWVDLEEHYIDGPRNTVARYILKVGEIICIDSNYLEEGRRVTRPLGIGYHTPTGHFYGRGWVGPQIGLNDVNERMLANQFRIVEDIDEFGIMIIPSTSGIQIEDLKSPERRKVVIAEPDPIAPDYKPFRIDPTNLGDFPAKVLSIGVELQDKWAGQGPLYQGDVPGRIDSAAGAGFVHETGNIPLAITSQQLATAFSQAYASILQSARHEAPNDNPFKLPIIDDRMIGVSINPTTGQLDVSQNPLPEPWEVSVDVAARTPTSKQQIREEALRMLEMGQLSNTEFEIISWRENLGFPIINRAKYEAWRKAVYQKIVTFNDGVQPGDLIYSSEADDAEVILLVITQFMASLEFAFASEAVRNKFIEWKITAEQSTARRYPDGMPYPEQAAQMQPPMAPGGQLGSLAIPEFEQ